MRVCFIGAGPGDPELLTVRGLSRIGEADIIVYAGSLVNPALLQHARRGAEVLDSASMTLEQVTDVYRRHSAEPGLIARLHTGDPSIYGAVQEQIDFCREAGIPVEVVPGVSSMSAAAAALEQELTLPGISQTVILSRAAGRTPVPGGEDLARLAATGSTLALFLSVQRIREVADTLMTALPTDTPAAVVYRASWPEQTILRGTLSTIAAVVREAGIDRQAVVIVGKVLSGAYERSQLYDPGFSHGFRRGGVTGSEGEHGGAGGDGGGKGGADGVGEDSDASGRGHR